MRLKWKDTEEMVISTMRDITDDVAQKSDRTRRYEPKDLINWWNNAQVRLSVIRPREQHYIYAPEDGCEVKLPAHFFRPRGVFLRGIVDPLERMSLEAYWIGGGIGYTVDEEKLQVLGIGNSPGFLFKYHAYYPPIENENSWVFVPRWATEACIFYVGMQAVTQEMMRDARYRKFISKQDAGNPQQTPFIPVAEWLRERFYEIVNNHTDDDQGL